MRIIHVFHQYYPVIGGMEKVVQGLAEAQFKLGHEVYVITSTFGAEDKPLMEILNDVHIQRIKSRRLHYLDLTIPKIIPNELLKKADIVHVHAQNSLFSLKILNETFKLGVKNACYFMAVDTFQNHPSWFLRNFAPYYEKRNIQKALRQTNLALVKSLRDLNILKNVYGVDATYLPDGVGNSILTSKKENPGEFEQKFGIRQKNFFLFIGRMQKLKGPHVLIEALKYIKEDIAVVFIGPDGGYLKETLNLAERLGVRNRVYMLGYVDEATKIGAIDSAVGLVLPSIADYETYPGVISEAWAREKPVIASRVGGITYRIKQLENGILVDPSNPQMLADAMVELINNDKLAHEMGRNGKVDVFLWETIAEKSICLYNNIMGEKK